MHADTVAALAAAHDLSDRRAEALDDVARALRLDDATRARVVRTGDAAPLLAALAARGITPPSPPPSPPPWTDEEAAAYRADLRARRG